MRKTFQPCLFNYLKLIITSCFRGILLDHCDKPVSFLQLSCLPVYSFTKVMVKRCVFSMQRGFQLGLLLLVIQLFQQGLGNIPAVTLAVLGFNVYLYAFPAAPPIKVTDGLKTKRIFLQRTHRESGTLTNITQLVNPESHLIKFFTDFHSSETVALCLLHPLTSKPTNKT